MQPNTPFALIPLALNHANLNLTTPEGFEISRFLFPGSLLLSPLGSTANGDGYGDSDGGGMGFSKVGEKFLSSVRSARSLGFLPSSSDRPEVTVPVMLRKSEYLRLWYKPDTTFSSPKAYVKLDFYCPFGGNSPEANVLTDI